MTPQEYNDYIRNSSVWQAKRAQRLEIDEHKCAICGGTEGLQVHHLTYERLGNEDPLNDLVTACKRHHHLLDTLERFQRYARRKHTASFVESVSPIRQEANNYGMANIAVSIDFIGTAADAQRADGRSTQQVLTGNQTGFVKAHQNRR